MVGVVIVFFGLKNNMIPTKVYDCFMFFNELELLDLRIKVMDPYVDYFVLVESVYTHTGKLKRLIFDENKILFNNPKIIHIIVEDYPMNSIWGNENFQRNCITKGLGNANPNDIIIVSDIDEIPNPETLINNLHLLDKNKIFSLKQKLFYFYINLFINGTWRGSTVSRFKDMSSPQKMRNRRSRLPVNNGGWHYSYLGDKYHVSNKIKSFAHSEFNIDEFTNINHIEKCMSNGLDIFERGKKYRVVDIDGNSPDCIDYFIEKYPHLVKSQHEKIS